MSPHAVIASAPRALDATILIVDDAADNVGVLRKMMVQQGYQTYVASSGERALQIARRVHPDLILLDVVMPGIDGFDTCRRLKADADTRRIPVIFMSARTEAEDVVAGLEVGAVDYISKPYRMAEVCARVRTQLAILRHQASQNEQADRLRSIVAAMPEGLLVCDAEGRIESSNPASDRLLGYPAGELAGRSLRELLSPSIAQQTIDWLAVNARAGDAAAQLGSREVLVRQCDGAMRAMDLSITPMLARPSLFVVLLHDISHHKQSETDLQRAALVDPLTKIANRRHFDSVLDCEWQRAMRSGQPLSLVVLDVDHFKLYNDSLGHNEGDLCLQRVAATIQSHALRSTDLAARYGGEEFVVLFAETPHPSALALAETIRRHIEELGLPHPRSVTAACITVSIGVATMVPSPHDGVDKLFVAADRAMYCAKEAGRNRVHAAGAGQDQALPV